MNPYITKSTRPLNELERYLNWFNADANRRYNEDRYIAKCEIIK